ncbi:MAG: ADP-ribosyl-(dinitrogen reductase) hydrolase [Zetaproteobacteria bacterium]|nr:ADP-ribosyl-(dinitrogen reductase) hydrolase [Zetaproteobacteria bacterium]
MQLICSEEIESKLLEKHGIELWEVEFSFANFEGYPLEDNRAQHRSIPTTVWFLSETHDGRVLKVVIIPEPEKGFAVLRTAYEADTQEIELWNTNTSKT